MSGTELVKTDQTELVPTSAEAYIARVVPVKVRNALNLAHQQFFGALADPEMSAPDRTILAAFALVELKKALDGPILDKVIMPLMNTNIGFQTDKNPAKSWGGRDIVPYDREIVLECAAEAWLHGLPMYGNMWNIIAESMYVRKEGFEYKVQQLCTYSVAAEVPAIPQAIYTNGGYLTVPCRVKYRPKSDDDDAEPKVFARSYKVRMTKKNKVGVEYAEGKAVRKILRDLYALLSGTILADQANDSGEAAGVHQVAPDYAAIEASDLPQAPEPQAAEGVGPGHGFEKPAKGPPWTTIEKEQFKKIQTRLDVLRMSEDDILKQFKLTDIGGLENLDVKDLEPVWQWLGNQQPRQQVKK